MPGGVPYTGFITMSMKMDTAIAGMTTAITTTTKGTRMTMTTTMTITNTKRYTLR